MRILRQKNFSKTASCREAEKKSKNDLKTPKKIAHAYGSKSKFRSLWWRGEKRATQTTEPNQALQRMTTLVTDRAPSCTLRAKRGHR
jgi:hypothetical protein